VSLTAPAKHFASSTARPPPHGDLHDSFVPCDESAFNRKVIIVAHPSNTPQRPPGLHAVADHRFSDDDLACLLAALRARAESDPGNPGLIACWPAVPAELMAAACGLLERRGHAVRPVTVTLWDRERTRAGWTVGAPPLDGPAL